MQRAVLIPNDIVLSFLKLLSPKEIAKSRRVCKLWRNVVDSKDAILFREPTLNEFGIEEFYQNFNSWRILYSKASTLNVSGLWFVNAKRLELEVDYFMYVVHNRKNKKLSGEGVIQSTLGPVEFNLYGTFEDKGLKLDFIVEWEDGKKYGELSAVLNSKEVSIEGDWHFSTDTGFLKASRINELNQNTDFFGVLPTEVIKVLFQYLSVKNSINIRATNRLLNHYFVKYIDWEREFSGLDEKFRRKDWITYKMYFAPSQNCL